MGEQDSNGKAVEIEWLKASLVRIENKVDIMGSAQQNFFTESCPLKHEKVEQQFREVDRRADKLESRQNYFMGIIAAIVLLANLFKDQIGKIFQ